MPRLAGAGGLSYRRFAAVHMPVSLAWGAGLVALGAAAGAAYQQVGALLARVGLAALVLLAAGAAVRRGRRPITD